MNKILIDKEQVILSKCSKSINIKTIPRMIPFGIFSITIDIFKSCDLEIDFNLDSSKINIVFNCYPNIEFNLYEIKHGSDSKIQYTFNVSENSIINIEKFSNVTEIKETLIGNLNGEDSVFNYTLKSIATKKQVYDIAISHNCKNTTSNINNNAINIEDGKVYFQVYGYVDKGIKGCILNHNNHIINLTNHKCQICPNLYISEYDTIANHSALIGGFNKEQLFYLMSRGIKEEDATKLMIDGFLLKDIKSKKIQKEIKNNIKIYWR